MLSLRSMMAPDQDQKSPWIFWLVVVFLSVGASIFFLTPLPLISAPVFLFLVWIANDFRNAYWIAFASIPFSFEYNFTDSLGTDLPSEPLMLGLTGLSLLLFFKNLGKIQLGKYLGPLSMMVLMTLAWFFFTAWISENPAISIKVFLAKLWYIIPFYFLSIALLSRHEAVENLVRWTMWPLVIAVSVVLIRHSLEDFSFKSSNEVVYPIFRNHVSYAAILVIFIPYIWARRRWRQLRNQSVGFYSFLLILFTVGIYFSYTRAAIIGILIAIIAYYILHLKLTRYAIGLSLILSVLGVLYLSYDNNYLDFAPDYSRTITHTEFDNLIEATVKLEDISTMERVYRWVAGVEMIKEKPYFGFGPGCFYSFYSKYTLSTFQTYVSNNPDQSGIHNYYLMLWVEQGPVGLLLFLACLIIALMMAEKAYHRLKDPIDRTTVMAAALSLIIIAALNLINDLIETDKVGPFYFLSLALITIYYRRSLSDPHK